MLISVNKIDVPNVSCKAIETGVRREEKLVQLLEQRVRERLCVKHFIANRYCGRQCALILAL